MDVLSLLWTKRTDALIDDDGDDKDGDGDDDDDDPNDDYYCDEC